VPATAVQAALRTLFARWGMPQRIRVDHGDPWATWADVPTALALWWVGLGIAPVWNRPGRPTENAFVERCQGLLDCWGEPAACADLAAWQARLEWVVRTQREDYPTRTGQSRLAQYPELAQNPRRYESATEPQHFEVQRVHAYLAQGRWPRLVSKIGEITLYGQPYRVGRAWVGQQVWVRLDPQSQEWIIQAADGTALRRHAAAQLTVERIVSLQVAHPRPPSRKKKRHNLPAQEAS
jgi:hypothetical protein